MPKLENLGALHLGRNCSLFDSGEQNKQILLPASLVAKEHSCEFEYFNLLKRT